MLLPRSFLTVEEIQAAQESGVAPARLVVPYRDAQSFSLSNHYEQPLGAGDPGIDQVALEQHEVLHGHRNHHRRELRALRLVDGHRVGQGDFVQLSEFVWHQPVVEADRKLLFDGIDLLDDADIAVEHFLLVVVLSLDNLVTHLESPSKPFSGGLTRSNRVQSTLKRRVQLADTNGFLGSSGTELGYPGWG